MKRPREILIAALFLSSGWAVQGGAATLGVPAAFPTIAAGLDAAAAGDTVLVASGTYPEHDLILRSGVTLLGETGSPSDVVIDGQRAGRCIYGAGLDAGTRIQAVTLANGLPAWGSTPDESWGGGLYVDGGALTVEACVFLGNETAIGGGAHVKGSGGPAFLGCVFESNQATEVAGLILRGTCNPLVRDCIFRGAWRTLVGGGLTWAGAGTALIEGCTFENNTVWETGGAVELLGPAAIAILRNCLIQGNSAVLGAGGLYVGDHSRARLEGCTITGNTAQDFGGGLHLSYYAVLEARETTILGNSAPTGPDGHSGATATATLTCCQVDLASWAFGGSLIVDDEGCAVGTKDLTWGAFKALFR